MDSAKGVSVKIFNLKALCLAVCFSTFLEANIEDTPVNKHNNIDSYFACPRCRKTTPPGPIRRPTPVQQQDDLVC